MRKNRKVALILNIILFLLEAITLVFAFKYNKLALEYYTNDSNIFTMITSLLFIINYKFNKNYIKNLRFISTVCLTVTFIVVLFIICPENNFNYKYYLLTDSFLMFHTICPIISFISYVFFEEPNNNNFVGIGLTIVYGIILIILNLLKIVNGPYSFLMIRQQGILLTIFWFTILITINLVVCFGLNKLSNKKQKGANV